MLDSFCKRSAFILLLLAPLWALNAPRLYAVDVLTNFRTTISKLEISKDGGATFITVFEGSNVLVDLVQLKGGGVGTFLGEADIPAGTYNRARVTVTAATLIFTVDGTGIQGATNITANNTGVLTSNIPTLPGAPTFPLTRTYNIRVECKHGSTTEATIDFDAQTSFSGLRYTDDDGGVPGEPGGVAVSTAALIFDPVVTVTN